ncbi:acyl-CoA thioesterase [Zooshikella marina]|uniref:acyl-CoA thioesterase n=1 Tax=Zooshikella ganghwensis TaxID=202772 RepID=UPI001BAF4743|nr:thioesterase family protein [Zooshikella ganghwensis]MBU2704653.1 acyl-CoA thioesterase [Zooshikella ganghwensis]
MASSFNIASMPVVLETAVEWGQMDALGHINNTVYFRYFENVRIAYFERLLLGNLLDAQHLVPVLAETSCRFKMPLVYPDKLVIGAKVTEILTDRLKMQYVVFSQKAQRVAAEGFGTVVCFDISKEAKTALPDHVVEAIRKLEGSQV